MKKIIVCMCLVLFIGTAYATEELRLYYNSENGWVGYAGAIYYGPDKNNAFDTMAAAMTKAFEGKGLITKLSKMEQWLCWKALGEYDIADNEIYSIMIQTQYLESFILVRIKNNRRSFDWVGNYNAKNSL